MFVLVVTSSANFTNMTHGEWALAEKVNKILSPFQDATKKLSDHSTSLADVWPIVKSIETVLKYYTEEEGVKTLVKGMLYDLENRFSFIKENDIYLLATTLDPRYKNVLFSEDGQKSNEKVVTVLKENMPLSCLQSRKVLIPKPYRPFTGTTCRKFKLN